MRFVENCRLRSEIDGFFSVERCAMIRR